MEASVRMTRNLNNWRRQKGSSLTSDSKDELEIRERRPFFFELTREHTFDVKTVEVK